jgi:hypothetical protein
MQPLAPIIKISLYTVSIMKIKFIPVMSFLILISLCSCAQNNEVYFKLNWKVGEEKLISISTNAKAFRDGKLIQDTSAVYINKITVTGANDSAYFVDYRMENDLLKYGSRLYKNLETELTDESYIVLNYRIDKITLKTELLNVHKTDSVIDESYDLIIKMLESKVPDKILIEREKFDLLHKELKEMEVESNILLPTLLYSYNKKFVIGDTLSTVDSLANPFKLQKFEGAKLKSYISKKSNKTIDITVDKTYDFAAYKLMIKEMSDRMESAVQPILIGTEQVSALMSSMLNSMSFEAAESKIITRKLDSSWPIKIVQHTTMNVKDGNNESSTIINMTVEIK